MLPYSMYEAKRIVKKSDTHLLRECLIPVCMCMTYKRRYHARRALFPLTSILAAQTVPLCYAFALRPYIRVISAIFPGNAASI